MSCQLLPGWRAWAWAMLPALYWSCAILGLVLSFSENKVQNNSLSRNSDIWQQLSQRVTVSLHCLVFISAGAGCFDPEDEREHQVATSERPQNHSH